MSDGQLPALGVVSAILAIVAGDVTLARLLGAANDAEARLTGLLALLSLVFSMIVAAVAHCSGSGMMLSYQQRSHRFSL